MKNKNLLKILFVEDLPSDSELAVLELRKEGLLFEHKRVDTRGEFINALNEFRPDIVISDYMMPSYNGMLALIDAREFDPSVPFILCTGSMNEETAVECIKAGANDYVIKEHLTRLPFAVIEAIEQHRILIEKRAAELLLKESEERFRILYNDAVVGLYRTNLQGEIFLANKTLVKMLGFKSFEELAARNLKETGYGPKYQRQEFIDQIEKSGEVKDLEAIWICRDGEEIFIRESAKAIYDSDGKILYYDGTVQNITEQKKAAEALNKIQHLFETLARVSPVGIFRTNPEGNTTYVNPKYSDLTGLSVEAALGEGWLNAVHPDDVEKLEESWLSDSQSRKISSSEYRFLRPDGSIVWVMGNAVPEWINNEIVGYIGTITDITEFKCAEDKLKSSEERFKILFDYAPDAYYLSDLKGNFIDGNIAAEKLLGYSKNELIGKSFLKLKILSLNQSLRAAKLLVRNTLGHGTGPDEFEISRKDGSKVAVEIITHPIKIKGQTLVLGIARDITERKLAEEALRESEEKFKAIYQSSNDAIMLLNENGFFDCNEQALKIFKVNTKEEFVKFSPSELSPPVQSDGKNSFEAVQENISIAYREGYNRFDWIHRRVDGEDFYAEVLLSAFDLKGERVLQATVRDITERKRAAEGLKDSEEKYHRIFENIQDTYYESLLDGTILEVSPSIEVISHGQYHREDIIGKSLYEFYINSEERQLLLSTLKEKGMVSDFEITLKNKDGSLIPCSISAKINSDAGGRPEKIIGSMHDITDRKRAEKELKHNLAFRESLLKTIPFGMDIVDETGTVLYQNDIFNILFEKEGIGKKCWELYRDDQRQCMDCPLIKGIIVGETEVYESHGVLGNRIFEIIHTGMMYRGKKAMLEIFQDITDRKKNEKELIDAKDKAEESDRLKTAFLHNISHEIRTPMNAIVGFSALLGEPALDAETQQSYIETIMQSSNHLLSIITDIIDISNIEANIVKIARTGINVNFTLNSICNQFSIKAGEKKIKLICETGLTDSGALIITDNTKLTQILTNLLSNAIKFTDEGTVKLSCRMVANFLEFSVSDTGIGIPAEYHAKIFDRFYQVQNAVSRLYEGTGLGLAISKAYVDLMGGKIWLSSEPGKGTTFTFTIPYEKQVVVPEPVVEKQVNEGFVFAEKKTILVAEDIDSNFKLINYFLSKSNTNILRAFNGKEAVEIALAEKDIDLILMDIKMPEMDGYTAVKLIREANIKTPIIVQTAYADDKEKVIECGCNGHISKPFDKKTLLKVISECIGRTSPTIL